jgi:RIO kinase 1
VNVPPSLLPLVDDGIIEEVVRPLMSGKEAQVFLVVAGGRERVAKVYKDAARRSFKHKSDYTEGRRTRNTRDQRAMAQRTKHGRSQDEAAWRSTEVDMIYRLRAAGVRVPEPYIFSDGVLVMEFITNGDGLAAPRLGDAAVSPDEAVVIFETLMQEVIRMLCAGVVHGDLSDFNVLLSDTGPVVIDFPQAMDAAGNRNARNILIRDVDNLHRFLERATRGYRPKPFAQEMWALYERGELLPDTKLKGLYRPDSKAADMGGLLRELQDAKRDAVRAGLAVDDEPGARGRAWRCAGGGAGLRVGPGAAWRW